MPARSELEKRYAKAQAEQRQAAERLDQAVAHESAGRLQRLKQRSVDRRFAALADPNLGLTAAHRRELVASIRERAAVRPAAGVATATRWEVWRSRLRYRLFSVGVTTAAVVIAVVLVIVANHRTPTEWAKVVSAETIPVDRTYPDGRTVLYSIPPGGRYAVIRYEPDQVELRDWEPGVGYATFWVRRDLLAAG